MDILNPPSPKVPTYIVLPDAYTLSTKLDAKPSVVFLFVKLLPPSVDILKPADVAAYTILPDAYTPLTVLLPKPFEVVLLVKVTPPSIEILKP